MNEISKLGEAKRLHEIGFGIHWIRPHSKAPVEGNWQAPIRDSFTSLKSKYQKGYGIGTKLGEASVVDEHYLAVLDVDIKSGEERHQKEARRWLQKNFGADILATHPITLSGRGNGSMHVWLRVDEPLDSRRLTASHEEVEVYMPSAKPTAKQIELLGQEKIDKGLRLRPAWEIDFMCVGRQVVLPPTIHPDSGKPYRWKRPVESPSSIPVFDVKPFLESIPENKTKGRPKGGANTGDKFELTEVDERELEERLPPHLCAALMDGDDVSDRSATCLSVALVMVKEKFTDAEILWTLTNRSYYLGDVAFDHAKTTNRNRAARWVFDYCIRKARSEADAKFIFDCDIVENDPLSEEEALEQAEELITPPEAIPWKSRLDRAENGNLKPTLKNVAIILINVVDPEIFKRDLFSRRDSYGVDTPWGGKTNELLSDDDCVLIKDWLANNYSIEPSVHVVSEAMILISSSNASHPLRDELHRLLELWDGKERVNTWIKDYLGGVAPEPYLSEISRKFLVAAVARVFEPGRKFDYMLILEGLQGLGKSTMGEILSTPKYFLDSLPDLQDKDAALNLQGMWFVEFGELAGMKKTEIEVVKAYVARRIDKVRPPYGKRMIESARQCVFFGTTNADEYLIDKSGNRRFWPVKVYDIDFDALKRDRDQLWAEAVWLYMNYDEDLWLKDEVKSQAEMEQEKRMLTTDDEIIETQIREWLDKLVEVKEKTEEENYEEPGPVAFTIKDLFDSFAIFKTRAGSPIDNVSPPLADKKADNWTLQKVSNTLRKLGMLSVKIKGYKVWKTSEG